MQLNTVVLPAPFGPINAVILPLPTSKDRSSTATRPPKRMVKCSTRSSVSDGCCGRCGLMRQPCPSTMTLLDHVRPDALALLQIERRLAGRDQSARAPDHDHH